MDIAQMQAAAKGAGFEIAEPLDPGKLEFRQDIRDMCAPDKCRHGYGKRWSCPPAGVPLEELRDRAKAYAKGILVQTVCHMEDAFDYESVMETAKLHSQNFNALADTLRDSGEDVFPMGAGACRRCEECTYPDQPCRFPDRMITSMEASGLFVSQVCKDNALPYYYGENTVAYCSCILYA